MLTLLWLSLPVASTLLYSLLPNRHQTSSILHLHAQPFQSSMPLLISFTLHFMLPIRCCFLRGVLPDSQPQVFFPSSWLQHFCAWAGLLMSLNFPEAFLAPISMHLYTHYHHYFSSLAEIGAPYTTQGQVPPEIWALSLLSHAQPPFLLSPIFLTVLSLLPPSCPHL